MTLKILLIEDDESQRYLLRYELTGAGYEVIEATNGDEGINVFKKQPCDLVITDIFMPVKEGLETILELKQLGDVKIIAISAGGLGFDKTNALTIAKDMGADHIMTKPIRIKQLDKIIKELTHS